MKYYICSFLLKKLYMLCNKNKIKFIIFDFDGVLTDGKFYCDNYNNI